jgi:hypothetical protein
MPPHLSSAALYLCATLGERTEMQLAAVSPRREYVAQRGQRV